MRTWIIGTDADCDLVVAQPTVSSRHCRLSEIAGGYVVEDLGASNGTYVNGERIKSKTRVTPQDVVTLGATVRMPWPAAETPAAARVIRIGRSTDNDIVIDDPRVSSHHARIIISRTQTLIEDLGSSNGTFVNTPDHKAKQPIPLTEGDVVSFGSLTVTAAQLMTAEVAPDHVFSPAQPSPRIESRTEPVTAKFQVPPNLLDRWAPALLAQSATIAVLIVAIAGRPPAMEPNAKSLDSVAQWIAGTTFALGLAAIWLGASLAAWSVASGRLVVPRKGATSSSALASLTSTLSIVIALCIAQCAVLLAIVHWGCDLRGPWLAMFGMSVLASAVGLSLGLFASRMVRRPKWAAAALALAVSLMIAGGGCIWPLPRLNAAARMATCVIPSRWAFEGLLLLETDTHATSQPPLAASTRSTPVVDMAERFFPAKTERMGPEADALALAAMLISLTSLAVFISPKPAP